MDKDKGLCNKSLIKAIAINENEVSQLKGFNTHESLSCKYLPPELHKNGFKYTLVLREGRLAIYCQQVSAKTKCFEVFIIKTRPAKEIYGKKYPEREVFPANEDFGYTAWSCNTLDRAKMRFINLENVKP